MSPPAPRRALSLLLGCAIAIAPHMAQARAVGPESGQTGPPDVTDEPAAPDEDEVRGNPQLQRAMDAYNRGTKAYNEARYQDALEAFQEAAALYGSPDFQYNIGLCYEKLEKREEAIGAFETYLRTKPDAADRANVEDRIRRLREEAEAEPDDAEPAVPTTEPTTDQPPLERPGRAMIIAGSVLAGFGAAVALGGGIGFGVAAKDKSDELDEVQSGGNPKGLTFEEAQQLDDDGQRLEALQITVAALGAAVAVTGAVLIAVGFQRRKKAASTARLHLVPQLGRHGTGVSLTGRF